MQEMQVELKKNGKRKWTVEQKLNMLNELNSGLPAVEICRKYNLIPQLLSKWKKSFELAGKESTGKGGVVPKSQYLDLVKKVGELERALGRKSLENEILIFFSSKRNKFTRMDVMAYSLKYNCSY
jgi:transposase-like protein